MARNALAATAAAKLHVEELRTNKFGIGKKDPNPLTEDLHHAVTRLSAELYTKDVHFLMELIQAIASNAEDNEYPAGVRPTLEFVLTAKDITRTGAPSTLLIFNNEVGFSRKNIDSICSVGRSTKKGKRQLGFIGEKGIGFKSVFLVSAQPHIFSNGYQVKFREAPNRDCGIGYIVPEWVEQNAIVFDACKIYGAKKILPATTIILPLKPEKVEAVKTQLSELHPELLLFLCKIKRLSVRANNNNPKEGENVSAIFISNETDQHAVPSARAYSCVVHFSAKEKLEATDETCRYFMWRQSFHVKPENKVSTRNDVEDWIISLAFPFGKRLKRGTSSIGIFAFLPTAMVTNFPFIIQSDFILASSRETILLDNKCNMGILGCIPSAFFSAFSFFVKESSPFSAVAQAFEFLPAQASSITDLNNTRESIRSLVQGAPIIPCEMFCGIKHYYKPGSAIRVQRKFRDLLYDVQKEGITLKASDGESKGWYGLCIQKCNFILKASEGVYVKLLFFIANMPHTYFQRNFKYASFLKYVDEEGKVKLQTSSASKKILYAIAAADHAWLIKWNKQFRCPAGMYFLPDSAQKAILSHASSSFLCSRLSSNAGLTCYTVFGYAWELCHVLASKNEPKLAIEFAHFMDHSYSKGLISESELISLCGIMPIVDGSGSLRKLGSVTLYIGEPYAECNQFFGGRTPEKELRDFLVQHLRAKDLPELCPPDTVLVLTSCLTTEQAFLLLDCIRYFRTKDLSVTQKFIGSIRDGRWMKTCLGFSRPSQSVLLDTTGTIVFEMMKTVLDDFFVLDLEFYRYQLCSYADELKYLGVRFGFDDLQRVLATCFKSLTSSSLSKEHTYSLLMFISISTEKQLLDQEWLDAIKEGKWLLTSKVIVLQKKVFSCNWKLRLKLFCELQISL
ncbi:hypothetical protein DITRI_Ditri10aG0057600 [Diplodiscus trichospermus]